MVRSKAGTVRGPQKGIGDSAHLRYGGLASQEPRGLGSGPAYSRYFKQIAKAVVLPRP